MALKLDVHGFCQLLILFLVVSLNFEKCLALQCYGCKHTKNSPNEDCLEANVEKMRPSDCPNNEGCMTQILLQEDSNEVQILLRGCQGKTEDGCEDNGRNCYYTCPTALCNDKTYEPPTTTEIPEAPTTTPVPVECFACGYVGGEDTDHCKIVNAETRKVKCSSGNCSTIVQFPADDLVNLMSLSRSCVKHPYESYCQKLSDQLNCGTFCTGHVCNGDPYDVLPEVGDNGKGPSNGQSALTTPSRLCSAAITSFILLYYNMP